MECKRTHVNIITPAKKKKKSCTIERQPAIFITLHIIE